MTFSVTQNGAPCGAIVEGLDLTKQLDSSQVAALRQEWLRSHILIFPNQELSDDDLERYSLYFGHFGYDPFIAPIDGRDHVVAVERKARGTGTCLRRGLAQRLELPGSPSRRHMPLQY